jgi:endonuclease G
MPEVFLERMGYAVSFNPQMNIPNWVAWELNAERLIERESRSDRFVPDPNIDASKAITTDEYKGCGWDRGHMCPAGDNRWHWRAMDESFYMTNICPQNHNLNAGVWSSLEHQCREWAEKGHTVHVACGPIIDSHCKAQYIGDRHKVRVPDGFFKVVLYGLESNQPKAFGFIFENKSGKKPLIHYARTVDEIEALTGHDFFASLDDILEQRLEATKYDL